MITITIENLRGYSKGWTVKQLNAARKYFSYDLGYWAKQAMMPGQGQVYMITAKGTFINGLANDLIKYLKEMNISYQIIDNRTNGVLPPVEDIKLSLKSLPFTLRPYQLDMVTRGCLKRNGIFHAATGAGKSIVMSAIIFAWDAPTLVLVGSKDLMYQLQKEFSEYRGMDIDEIGIIGDGRYNPQRVTIAMVQSITNSRSSKKKKAEIKRFMKSIRVLCIDEVHNAQAKSYRTAVRSASEAYARFGFSATPVTSTVKDERGEKTSKDIVLRAYFGRVLSRVTTLNLIELGYLAKPEINIIQNDVYFDGVTLEWAEEYSRIIIRDDERNQIIAKIINRHYQNNESIVGFVTRIEHGEVISRILQNQYDIPDEHIVYVTGQAATAYRRKEDLQAFKDGHVPILLGTVLSEGLNFMPDVGINISSGDSEKNAIQRLGRVLRKKRNPVTNDVDTDIPRHVKFYDFADNGHKWFSNHSKTRIGAYREEGHKIKHVSAEDV